MCDHLALPFLEFRQAFLHRWEDRVQDELKERLRRGPSRSTPQRRNYNFPCI